jgi:hypothetical protein
VAAVTLPKIIRTGWARSIHTGRRECIAARTEDGTWEFEHEEVAGTPWAVFHRPSLDDGSWLLAVTSCSSLRRCQRAAASGALDRELADRKAAHAAQNLTTGSNP